MSLHRSLSPSDAHRLLTGGQDGVAEIRYAFVTKTGLDIVQKSLGAPVSTQQPQWPTARLLVGAARLSDVYMPLGVTNRTLVEVCYVPSVPDAVVPVRIVDDFCADEVLRQAAVTEFNQEIARLSTQKSHIQVCLQGLLGYLVSQGTHSLYQRMRATLESLQKHVQVVSRLDLQIVLTDLGLGSINKLTTNEVNSLTGDQFAQVLATAKVAHQLRPDGGLYYLMEKGTRAEDFTRWYENLCRQHGWNPDKVDGAIALAQEIDMPITADLLREATNDMVAFTLQVIPLLEKNPYSDVARKAVLTFMDGEGARSVNELLRASMLPSRDLSKTLERMIRGEASTFEAGVALVRAYDAGVSSQDPYAVEVCHLLPQYMRILMIRGGGEQQNWAFELIGNAVGPKTEL